MAREEKVKVTGQNQEIVLYKPHPNKLSIVPSVDDNEIVHQTKLLGVLLGDNFSFEDHVNAVLTFCSQRFYVMKTLRDGGKSVKNLHAVFFCAYVQDIHTI
jgi:hypothetical protein